MLLSIACRAGLFIGEGGGDGIIWSAASVKFLFLLITLVVNIVMAPSSSPTLLTSAVVWALFMKRLVDYLVPSRRLQRPQAPPPHPPSTPPSTSHKYLSSSSESLQLAWNTFFDGILDLFGCSWMNDGIGMELDEKIKKNSAIGSNVSKNTGWTS